MVSTNKGKNHTTLTSDTFNKNNQRLHVNSEEIHALLDNCLKAAANKDFYSIANLIQGHPEKKTKTKDVKPIAFARLNSRLGKAKPTTLKCLLDSGASGSLIAAKHAEKLRKRPVTGPKTVWTTPAGTMSTTHCCQCTFMLPEFHRDRVIEWDINISSTNLGAYDMILGRDVLQGLGIKFDFSNLTIEWDEVVVPMRDTNSTEDEAFYVHEPEAITSATEHIKTILDAKYEKADLQEIARDAKHLSASEQAKLHALLTKYQDLFDGSLGKWKMDAYEIELLPDAKPYHARAYPIPQVHTATLKMEVDRLVKAGVLRQVNQSEWAAPTFIIPKKDGSVRFISDFRELNKRIKRKPFPIPKIQDMLLKLEGFQFATSLDLNMGYYHIELNPDSRKLCTIVLPWGKYEYLRLPMGLCNSPDIFQEKMSTLMQDLEFVRAYIDDLLAITKGSFDDHLEKLDIVLARLREAGLKVNAKKSFFAQTELEYLGYWITRDGIRPTSKKVNAISNIAPPKTKKQLRSFIGMVNYYRDMWIRRSHVLAPLAALTSKTTQWKWGPKEQESFDTMKRIIAKETMLAYPDFNKEFVIHTDASHEQLGAVISQDNCPIAFYSRKLKPEQTRYTTTERELLSIVETLKEFRNILLGHKVIVHTNHKNLTCKNFNTERVMRWRLILEEYGPTLNYIKGEKNIVADALSRLDMVQEPLEDPDNHEQSDNQSCQLFAAEEEDVDFPKDFPLTFREIAKRQQEDRELQRLRHKPSYAQTLYPFGDKGYKLITKDNKIVLPRSLQAKAIQWYHEILLHPGETRTELTIGQHFTWVGMQKAIQQACKRCATCQLTKPKTRQVGHLPPKQAETIPWERLCIDLIGPYTIGAKGEETSLHCLTMIDPVTGWFEIEEIPGKSADIVMDVLERTWLTRYPKPAEIIMDRGTEFMAEVRSSLQDDYGITHKNITTRNPQANAMVERAHQTVHNLIASLDLRSKHHVDAHHGWKGILSAVAFAMRATVHSTAKATPMQLVFGRDAVLNIRFQADWHYLTARKQRMILHNNEKENAKRTPHTYQVGDPVMIENHQHRKYVQPRYSGPYNIDCVNDNGTVRLRQTTANGGAVYRTWNIRNIFPYKA